MQIALPSILHAF